MVSMSGKNMFEAAFNQNQNHSVRIRTSSNSFHGGNSLFIIRKYLLHKPYINRQFLYLATDTYVDSTIE